MAKGTDIVLSRSPGKSLRLDQRPLYHPLTWFSQFYSVPVQCQLVP